MAPLVAMRDGGADSVPSPRPRSMSSSDASSSSPTWRRRPRSPSPAPQPAARESLPDNEEEPIGEAGVFYAAVYDEARRIPFGQVTSYGHIAKLIGHPRHSRMVGQALKFLPRRLARDTVADDDDDADLLVPWHRVLSSSGKISLRGSTEACERQAARLRAEGVEVRGGGAGTGDGGRVSLTHFGWFPTPPGNSSTSSDGSSAGRRVRRRQ